jgi:hypothetical protein
MAIIIDASESTSCAGRCVVHLIMAPNFAVSNIIIDNHLAAANVV